MPQDQLQAHHTTMPDLNWSQVRETVLMLELATMQINSAMQDSNASVDVLTHSFTNTADCLNNFSNTLKNLPDDDVCGMAKKSFLLTSENLSRMTSEVVVAFQFYDRLAQRLGNVTRSLSALSNLIADKARLFNPEEWLALQAHIHSQYATAEEKLMFEAVIKGIPVEEALNLYQKELKQDDIELF